MPHAQRTTGLSESILVLLDLFSIGMCLKPVLLLWIFKFILWKTEKNLTNFHYYYWRYIFKFFNLGRSHTIIVFEITLCFTLFDFFTHTFMSMYGHSIDFHLTIRPFNASGLKWSKQMSNSKPTDSRLVLKCELEVGVSITNCRSCSPCSSTFTLHVKSVEGTFSWHVSEPLTYLEVEANAKKHKAITSDHDRCTRIDDRNPKCMQRIQRQRLKQIKRHTEPVTSLIRLRGLISKHSLRAKTL